jgi:glutamine synthetase
MEINFAPKAGIEAADVVFTFKNGVKEIAQRHGYIASFMTQPWADQSANGCHYHQSLLDVKTGKNAFVGPDGSWTRVWRWWLGGQIAHAAALCALAAPTVNCPKAFGFSPVAPTNVTWGVENRTAAFRMKYVGGESAHIESRFPRGGSNPYLVLAGVLAAGLDGLRNKTEPPAETTGVAHGLAGATLLPARLDQAIAALEGDPALRAALGEEFIKLFLALKRHEIGKARVAIPEFDSPGFNRTVHEWERAEYFEFL